MLFFYAQRPTSYDITPSRPWTPERVKILCAGEINGKTLSSGSHIAWAVLASLCFPPPANSATHLSSPTASCPCLNHLRTRPTPSLPLPKDAVTKVPLLRPRNANHRHGRLLRARPPRCAQCRRRRSIRPSCLLPRDFPPSVPLQLTVYSLSAVLSLWTLRPHQANEYRATISTPTLEPVMPATPVRLVGHPRDPQPHTLLKHHSSEGTP